MSLAGLREAFAYLGLRGDEAMQLAVRMLEGELVIETSADRSLVVRCPLARLLDPDAPPVLLRAGLAEVPRDELDQFIEDYDLDVSVHEGDSADDLRTRIVAAVGSAAPDVV
jgi:hypothetical protein